MEKLSLNYPFNPFLSGALDGFRSLRVFWKGKTLSYNHINMVSIWQYIKIINIIHLAICGAPVLVVHAGSQGFDSHPAMQVRTIFPIE